MLPEMGLISEHAILRYLYLEFIVMFLLLLIKTVIFYLETVTKDPEPLP